MTTDLPRQCRRPRLTSGFTVRATLCLCLSFNAGSLAVAAEDEPAKESVQPAKEAEFVKPVFQLRNWDKDVKKAEVKDDSSNIAREKREAGEKESPEETDVIMKTPADCLAGKMPSVNEKIMWGPKWFYEGIGGVRLPSICLSPDKSVLALAETTGTGEGPNGSRIILINTYNWQILRIHEFPENKISNMCFINDRNRLALWSEKQSSIKKPYELIVTGIDKGGIRFSSREIKTGISGICSLGDFILVKSASDEPEDIFSFESDDISKPAKRIKSSNTAGVFALSQDKLRLALAGDRNIEIFETAGFQQIKKTAFDAGYTPENAVFPGRNDWLAVSANSKPAFLFKDSSKKQFCDLAGHILSYNAEDKVLFIEKQLNNEVSLLAMPELNEINDIIPASIFPKTGGHALFVEYLDHQRKYFIIDSNGNFSLYAKYLKTKKWKKKVILSAKK